MYAKRTKSRGVCVIALLALCIPVSAKVANEGKVNRTLENQEFIDAVECRVDQFQRSRELCLAGHHPRFGDEEFHYALTNAFANNDHELNHAFICVLSDRKKEVFSLFKEKLVPSRALSEQEKKTFLYWSKEVDDREMFCFVIDHFINDQEIASARKSRFGQPYRFCDMAYNVAYSQIAGVRNWSENQHLFFQNSYEERNQKISLDSLKNK